MLLNGRCYIGTSGWCYGHWRKRFYPKQLPASSWFGYYTRFFDTVELNATFYKLPEKQTFKNWGDAAPEGFLYAVKGSRFLTHIKRLRNPQEPIERLLTRARDLDAKLGPFLYQLPPTMRRDDERLAKFIEALPRGFRVEGHLKTARLWAVQNRTPQAK